jgi:glycosyltransferase involved in cell wall biosynthesis
VFRDSGYDFDYVPWNEKTVVEEILDSDVGIIPWPDIGRAERLKSSNRLVMFMSLGIPVIASPVPSYLPILRHGENGFIATEADQWLKFIEQLRDDPGLRRRLGASARDSVHLTFSKQRQAKMYEDIFSNLLETGSERPKATVRQ